MTESADQTKAAAELLARRRARASLERYIEYCELGFTPALHHRLILRELEAVERGEVRRLMVCLPPGAGESLRQYGLPSLVPR